MATNGKATQHPPELDQAPAPSNMPPWAMVPAEQIVAQLQRQMAAMSTEMAAMRVYIEQLHAALEVVGLQVTPAAEPAPS